MGKGERKEYRIRRNEKKNRKKTEERLSFGEKKVNQREKKEIREVEGHIIIIIIIERLMCERKRERA